MPKIWNKYSQKRTIGGSVPISTFMCLWANYIFPRWVGLFCWRKYVDWSWEYINRSKTHECGNWGWGRVIPRKGIYKRNCRCSAENEAPASLVKAEAGGGLFHPLQVLPEASQELHRRQTFLLLKSSFCYNTCTVLQLFFKCTGRLQFRFQGVEMLIAFRTKSNSDRYFFKHGCFYETQSYKRKKLYLVP